MARQGNTIIADGIRLLKDGKSTVTKFQKALKLAISIDTDISDLHLTPLNSPFGGDNCFEPMPLVPHEINYPIPDAKKDFSKIKPGDDENTLTSLERYGTFVATDAASKVSVYDLFKTAAAIQDCLDNGETEKPFLLVSADFSGIQDTVYTISSKGALKTLRARSFMLELLTEHIVYEILNLAEAERHAIIYSGGGGFCLLLPSKETTVKEINDYKDVLNRWCYEEFSAKLFIALEVLLFDEGRLNSPKSFQKLRQEQSDNLDKEKRRKFITRLDDLFKPKMPEQLTVQTECQITRRDDLDEMKMRDLESGKRMKDVPIQDRDNEKWIWVSESSFHQFKLGDKLIDAKMIYRFEENPGGNGYLTFKGINNRDVYYSVENNGNSVVTWQINSWENELSTILYADYVRTIKQLEKKVRDFEKEVAHEENRSYNEKNTATFDGLAACSCGADLIGSLRMDVDDMGNMFGSIGKLSELSAKSRMLNLFFKVYLNAICRAKLNGGLKPTDIVGKKYAENQGRNLSVIYAGGDDLFILGAWDETAELAFDIQRCFALFTGGALNPEKQTVTGGLGISGGLTLHQPKFPLYQMARKSGEAEHVAKQARKQLKNCFTPFLLGLDNQDKTYEFYNNKTIRVIDWNDSVYFDLLKNLVALTDKQFVGNQIDAVKLEGVSRGFIYKLFEAAGVWVTEGALYLPRLRYIFARLEKQYDDKRTTEIQKLQSLLFSPKKDKREESIKRLSLILNWFEQLQRSK